MDTRRKFLKTSLALGTLLTPGTALLFSQEKKTPESKDVDVTEEWRKVHADPKAAPPTSYRAGEVKASATEVKTEKTGSGYSIKLPGGTPVPTPAVYKDRVYVSAGFHSRQYFCVDAASGKQIWGVDLNDDGPSTAACEDDLVVVNTESCTIFTMEAATGKGVWSLFLGDPLMTAPTICRGRVFTSYPSAGQQFHPRASHLLGAFDLKTGKILWQRRIDGDVISAPVAVGDEVVAATFTGTVFRFKQESGELISAVQARATSAPIVVGKELHFSKRAENAGAAEEALCVAPTAEPGAFRAYGRKDAKYLEHEVQKKADLKLAAESLDAGNGFGGGAPAAANPRAAERNVGQGNVASLQAFQGSRVLRYRDQNFACMGNEVMCADPRDGKKLWSVKLEGDLAKVGGFLGAPPVAAGPAIFLATLAGAVLQMDPATGQTKKTWEVGSPLRFPPSIDAGRVFTGTQDGRLVCIETGDAAHTGWPQWGGNAQRTGIASK